MDHGNPQSEDKPHFRIGSALDILLTGDDEFENEFSYFDKKRPTGKMLIFIDNLPLSLHEESDESLFREAYLIAEYKTPLSSVIRTLWTKDNLRSYYEFRLESLGKTIISKEEMDTVIHLKSSLILNPFLKGYFIPSSTKEIYHQVPVYFQEECPTGDGDPIECKALLDGIIIDHERERIKIFDLKSTGRSNTIFPGELMKHSYFLQASHYTKAVKELQKGNAFSPVLASLPDYEIEEFDFLVASTANKAPARIWRMSETDLKVGRYGGFRNGRPVRGVIQLIDDYQWHVKTGKWDYCREYYNNRGVFNLNIFDNE